MVAILSILSIAGIVWVTYFVLRGSVVGGCAVYLIVASCFGYDYWNFDVAGISMSLDRLLLLVLVVAFIVQWRRGHVRMKPWTLSDRLLALFTLLLIAQTFTHHWRARAGDEVPIVQHLIIGYLIPTTLYWLVRHAPISRRHVAALAGMFVCFGVYLTAISMCEASATWSLVYPRYIADADLGIHFGRARGPFLQSVRLGTYLIVCLTATWLYLAHHGAWGRWGRAIVVPLVPLYAVAIYYTFTRSVWLGSGIAAIMVLGCTLRGAWSRLALIGLVIGSSMIGVCKWDHLMSFQREYGVLETRESVTMRASFAYVSWLMFTERPLLGYGFGQFPHENRPFLNDRTTKLRLESIRGYSHHNTFLSLLVELGVAGFILYVALLGSWAVTGWRLWRDTTAQAWMRGTGLLFTAFAGAYSVQMTFHDVTYSSVENGLFFLAAGLTVGVATLRDHASVGRTAVAASSWAAGTAGSPPWNPAAGFGPASA